MIRPRSHKSFIRITLVIIATFLTVASASHVSGFPPTAPDPVPVFLNPPNEVLGAVGSTVTVNITVDVDANGQPVSNVDAVLDFDPTILQVVDAPGIPATSIDPGPIVDSGQWVVISNKNTVDNSTGRIEFSAGKPGGGMDANSNFVLATILFERLSPSACTNVAFDTTLPPPQTKAQFGAADVTGTITDGTIVAASGDWIIERPCTIIGSVTAPANVIIEPGQTLTIHSTGTLDIDFSTKHLLIRDGAQVVIQDGGKIN